MITRERTVFLLSVVIISTTSGTSPETISLRNGRVLEDAVWKETSHNGVIFAHRSDAGPSLSLIPFHQLPPELQHRAEEDAAALPEPRPAENPTRSNPFFEERRAEIAENRRAMREAMIAAAASSRFPPPDPIAARQSNPIWNDLEILEAEFGLRHAVVRISNHGRTSRHIENWDLHIVFSDGSTRTPTRLRPNRIPPQSEAEITFRVPLLRYQVPRFLKFSRGDNQTFAVERNIVEGDFIGARRQTFRNRHHPAINRRRPPVIHYQIRSINRHP